MLGSESSLVQFSYSCHIFIVQKCNIHVHKYIYTEKEGEYALCLDYSTYNYVLHTPIGTYVCTCICKA